MANIQNKKRKIKSPIIKYISIAIIFVSLFMLSSVALELVETIELNKQLKLVEEKFKVIQKENEQLSSQKDKLEDENYVHSYARGNYMLSKEGEDIFYLPSDTKEEKQPVDDIPEKTPNSEEE